jgi:hypothetical protein
MTIEAKNTTNRRVSFEERTDGLGDAAVDGLLSGVAAGLVMGLYLLLVRLLVGESVAAVLQRFDSTGASSPLSGLLLHLAVSAVYGALFAAAYWLLGQLLPVLRSGRIGRFIWLPGLLYGLILWWLAHEFLLSATGSTLGEIPRFHFLIAHVLYGVSLALVLLRPADRA